MKNVQLFYSKLEFFSNIRIILVGRYVLLTLLNTVTRITWMVHLLGLCKIFLRQFTRHLAANIIIFLNFCEDDAHDGSWFIKGVQKIHFAHSAKNN